MFGFLKTIFGDKKVKDIKELQPYVEKVKTEYAKLPSLSNDELRERTNLLKIRIADHIQHEENKIKELREKAANAETSIDDKEIIFNEIEKHVKKIDDMIEEIAAKNLARLDKLLGDLYI